MTARTPDAEQIEAAILDLLGRRDPRKTICPSDAARALAGDADFRPLMDPVREQARAMVQRGALEVTQGGQLVDPDQARGAIRLRLPAHEWDPAGYVEHARAEVPDYDRLQAEVARATGSDAERVLELGVGTGETTTRVLEAHPDARLVGIDASAAMLDATRSSMPADRVDLRLGRLEDDLPEGPFDVVVSALVVHHLEGDAKAALFRQVAQRLSPDGRFVLGDLVVPDDPQDVVTPVDDDRDVPSSAAEQLRWLADAGLEAEIAWSSRDLAVLVGRPTVPAA